MTPDFVQRVTNAVMYYMREHADVETKQPFITIIRGLIQQVVIGPAQTRSSVEFYVHGAIDTIKTLEAEFRTAQEFEYHVLMTRRFLALALRTQKAPVRALLKAWTSY